MDRVTSMTAFTTVVASGSFAAAAKRLGMSPAMVTNHVKSLEERLGARLLNRTTRKLSLTEVKQLEPSRSAATRQKASVQLRFSRFFDRFVVPRFAILLQ